MQFWYPNVYNRWVFCRDRHFLWQTNRFSFVIRVSSFSISLLPNLLSPLSYPQNRSSASWDFATFTDIWVCGKSWAHKCKEEGWDQLLPLTILPGFQEQTSIQLMLVEQTPTFPNGGRLEKHGFWSQTHLVSNPSFPFLPVWISASYWTFKIYFLHLLNG